MLMLTIVLDLVLANWGDEVSGSRQGKVHAAREQDGKKIVGAKAVRRPSAEETGKGNLGRLRV
jgi:hypothetical protein